MVREIVERIVRKESGGVAYKFKIVEARPFKGQIGASNDLSRNEIIVYISPTFKLDGKSENYFLNYGYDKDKDILVKIVADIARHEIGHWEYPVVSGYGCPYDLFNAEEIYEGVREKIFQHLRSYSGYVGNAFMDIVDNTNVAYHLEMMKKEHYAGEVWFYYDQGSQIGTYSPFYDWFVRIQEDLWMGEADRKFLTQFHSQNPEIEEVEEEFFDRLGLTKGKYNLDVLMNKSEWRAQAGLFAELASKLLEVMPPVEILCSGEKAGEKTWLDKKIEDPNFVQRVIKKRWEEGKPLPSYIDKRKVLGMFYRGLAKDIPIIAEVSKESYSFPLVGYGRRESEGIGRKIGIDDKGEVKFYEPKYFWEIQIPVKRSMAGIPNLYFVLDCSESMTTFVGRRLPGNADWGDESGYHYALLGVYGIRNYLERMKIQPNKIGITSFSNTSRSLITERFDDIEEILFSPESGGTYLDAHEVKKIARTLGRSVMIMLSDGNIHNWDEVRNDVRKVMRNNFSAFISINEKSSPYYDLRDVTKVFFVERVEDLPKIMIDFTRKYYGD